MIESAYQTGLNMLPFEFELKVIMCTLFKTVVSENLPKTFLQTSFGFTFCHFFLIFFFFMPLKFDILQRLKTKMRLHLRLKSFHQKIFTVQVTNYGGFFWERNRKIERENDHCKTENCISKEPLLLNP